MAGIGITLTTNIFSTFIGKQVLGKAISDASSSIYTSIGSIFGYNSIINDTITGLDIQERIKTIIFLIKDVKNYTEAVEKCINSIHDIIIEIKQDLKLIEYKINNHKKKYLSRWRKLSCSKELKNLKIHSDLLEKRLEYLIKGLQIAKCNRDLKQ